MTLILAATPLGNAGDASPRLKKAIEDAQIIAAEDSRRFHRLCSDIEVTFTGRVISFFEGNEVDRTRELLSYLHEGISVLVVSDAGMPTISDPGFRLMRDAIAQNIDVRVIPGPSAPTMALALSGLPTDRFTFEGFAPRSPGARIAFYEALRFDFDLAAMRWLGFQCNDQQFDCAGIESIRIKAMPNLACMLNLAFFCEPDTHKRAFFYLDSVLLSGEF